MLSYSRSICAQNCSCLFLGSCGVRCYQALFKSAVTSRSSPLAVWVLSCWLPGLCPGRAISFWDSCSFFFSLVLESLQLAVLSSMEENSTRVDCAAALTRVAALQQSGPDPLVPAPGEKTTESLQPRHLAFTAPAKRKGESFRKFPALHPWSTSRSTSWRWAERRGIVGKTGTTSPFVPRTAHSALEHHPGGLSLAFWVSLFCGVCKV